MNPVDAYTGLANSITQTSDAVAALANALQGANLNNSNSDQGYRHLKPKKDLQKVTANDAKTLMIELADFEVDLGELGVPVHSEAAYRQLRAVCQGKARDIVDLDLVRGEGLRGISERNRLVEINGRRDQRDRCGAL